MTVADPTRQSANSRELRTALESWRGRRIVVLGDVMLDRFVYGHVARISPEGPIPVLRYDSERRMVGGAGNVARNIASLGGQAVLIGVLAATMISTYLVSRDRDRTLVQASVREWSRDTR